MYGLYGYIGGGKMLLQESLHHHYKIEMTIRGMHHSRYAGNTYRNTLRTFYNDINDDDADVMVMMTIL